MYPWPGADLVLADTASLPYPDQSFDTVTIIAALNHMPNRAAVLGEVHRVLRTGGRCIITMIPQGVGRLWHRLRRSSDPDLTMRGIKPGERFGLSRQEVRQLLAAAGLEIELEIRFMFGVNCLTLARKATE